MKGKILVGILASVVIAASFAAAINMSIEKKELKITPTLVAAPMPHVKAITRNYKPINLAIEGKKVDNAFRMTPRALTNVPVATLPEDEFHPTIATDSSQSYIVGYTDMQDVLTQDIYMAISPDGTTWQIAGYWNIDGVEDYPSFDYWGGTTFYGTFMPDPNTPYQYLMSTTDITDTSTYQLVYWDWSSYGWSDFQAPKIACDNSQNPWEYGFIATIASTTYTGYECTYAPHMFFADPDNEQQGYISWVNEYNNTLHCDVDIDTQSHIGYGVYDWQDESNQKWTIIVWERSFEDPLNGESQIIELTSDHNDTVPAVAAQNGYVYVVCQEELNTPGKQDVVCYYSHDGGATWDSSIVSANPAKDEMYPSIVAYGEGATCIFSMDGDLYYSHTSDGGATWSQPAKINEGSGSVVMDYRNAMITSGGSVVWTDNRNGNDDVYYDNVGVPAALITIESVKGGFGITATIKNIGTIEGKNVPWSISLDGTVFIGKEKSGTIDIAPGQEQTIKTGFILGIGSVTVTVNAGSASATAKGFMLGPFVLGLK